MLLLLRLLDAPRETWPLLRARSTAGAAAAAARPVQAASVARTIADGGQRPAQGADAIRRAQTASGNRSNLQ